jgi:hypothetical protein
MTYRLLGHDLGHDRSVDVRDIRLLTVSSAAIGLQLVVVGAFSARRPWLDDGGGRCEALDRVLCSTFRVDVDAERPLCTLCGGDTFVAQPSPHRGPARAAFVERAP